MHLYSNPFFYAVVSVITMKSLNKNASNVKQRALPCMIPLLLLLIFAQPARASFEFNERMKQAHERLFELRFQESLHLIEQEKKEHPDNKVAPYIEAYVVFLQLFIREEKEAYKEKKSYFNDLIDAVKDGDEESPYYRVCLAELYLLRASVRAKFHQSFGAAFDAYRAYRLFKDNEEDFPTFMPQHIGLGFLHAAIGSIPDNYKGYAKFVGLEGDIQQGVRQLELAYQLTLLHPDYKYLRTKAALVLSFAKHQLQQEAQFDLTKLELDVQGSLLLSYLQARILMQQGRNNEAIETLEQRPVGAEYFSFYYLDYLLGKAKLSRMDEDAPVYLEKYLRHFKGQNYFKSAYRYLSWHYLLRDNREKYLYYREKVKTEGNTYVGADQEAEKEADEEPNVVLLRARLLFDGGYYEKALDFLNSKDPDSTYTSPKEQITYYYRLGRIYQRLEDTVQATGSYREVIRLNEDRDSYFAANAALQMALMYEHTGNKEQAASFYKACLKYKNYAYYDGISQKAKAGLSRVE